MIDNSQQKNLSSYIKAVWLRGQMVHITAGLLAFCRWAIPLFLVGMVIDWKTNLPVPGRVAILAGLLAVSLYKAWRCGWRHGRVFNATHTALQIEEHHGGLKSLLVTAVQFQASKQSHGTSESLRQITCRRAEQAVAPLRPEETIRYARLRRPLVVALILAAVIGVFAVVNGPFLVAGVGRIFAPWLSIKYPTRTQLSLADGKMIVKEGEKVEIGAAVSGVIPKNAKLYLRTGEGKPRKHRLEIADGVCKYNIAAAYRSFEYRFTAGDARGDWRSVEVINSPRIERAEVTLQFPEYTKRAVETVEALTVTVPESTKIKWKLTLDRPVSKATYKPAGGEPNDLDISADGLTVTMEQVAFQSRAYSFSWVEREHGFAFDSSSHFLQVAPDQPPRVELTAPESNLYAMLGRKLDLAFRGSDDHGIGESVVAYTVNKTAEKKVEFTVLAGGKQKIDWDYRSALPNLTVGDSVSFVVEVADRYPGDGGPHRVRSQARRISFLSKEDYLEYIAKQKRRLLTRLRTIYREERGVHDVIRTLNPAADSYIQTCQIESVRQGLIGERLIVLKNRIDGLLGDLAANNITDDKETGTLVKLSSDLQTIAKEHVARAAESLRELASSSNGAAGLSGADPAVAMHMVNRAARELGCLVMQLGYNDAAIVMAYELHAAAQTQASLRLKTIMLSGAVSERNEAVSNSQDQLAKWLVQLFAATPKDRESKKNDAIIAFKLSRLAKMVQKEGGSARMDEAAKLIIKAQSDKAVQIQSEVIAVLLRAEFKLRVGAEHEALVKARQLFKAQADDQKKLRDECGSMSPDEFKEQRSEIGQGQAALHLNLQLLLMPAIPAERPRLFDDKYPKAPLVDDLLVSAEQALKNAAGQISKGDRERCAAEQKKAEKAFSALAGIVDDRINVVTESKRLDNLALNCNKRANSIIILEERQLVLLEKVEDAAADKAGSGHLASLQQGLAGDAEKFRKSIILFNKTRGIPNEADIPLLDSLGRVAANMQKTVALLTNNQPDKAAVQQEAAFELLEEANALITEQSVIHAGFSSMYAMTESTLIPGPLLAEIESEQRDMMAATGKADPNELPGLVIPQKNLVHAVDAVLDSLDPLAHRIESGTTMLFAKTDMDAAAEAIEEKDIEEAQDAQSYVADSIMDIRKKVDAVTPQYSYILEIVEFLHEAMPDGIAVRAQLGQLRGKIEAAEDAAALKKLAGEQNDLKTTAERFGKRLTKLTGHRQYGSTAKKAVEALAKLKSGDKSLVLDMIEEAEGVFSDDAENLGLLMENLAYLLAPPPAFGTPADRIPSAEVKLTLDILDLAARHNDLYRRAMGATPKQMVEFAKLEKKYESQCQPFIKVSNSNDHLVAAKKHMAQASLKLQGGSVKEARASMYQADQALRYFILEYVLEFVEVPPPAPPEDPAPNDDNADSDGPLTLFMPGAVSGKTPKTGRLEWQVLGRRDRAALNENFARELPLEYRGILKDYYERLAK